MTAEPSAPIPPPPGVQPRSAPDPVASATDIARYYDANTGKFLRFGGSGDIAAIHRAIWAPGVTTRAQAFQYLNDWVANALQPLSAQFGQPLRLLDLGCGVGGTATWLHQRLQAAVLGISLSADQVHMAQARALQLGCGAQVQFMTGDFENLTAPGPWHGACAIESFVHCHNPSALFASLHRQLLPGARLVICDDFAHPAPPAAARPWLGRFQRGWHINQLLSRDAVIALAAAQGFRVLTHADLSAYTRSFPWPLLMPLSQLTRLPLPWPYWQNLAGGTALQVCLRRGYTQYHALVWERV